VTFAVVAPPKEMILVMFKVFSPSDMMQYHTLLGKAVAVTYSKFRAPGFLFAVAKSKLRVMDLAASQSHPSLQLMATKLYEWAQTDDAIRIQNRAADLTPDDLKPPKMKRVREEIEIMDDTDNDLPKLPRNMKIVASDDDPNLGTPANPISLTDFGF